MERRMSMTPDEDSRGIKRKAEPLPDRVLCAICSKSVDDADRGVCESMRAGQGSADGFECLVFKPNSLPKT
jgi:hypothetical protein